jgi:WD40 repeat protein
VLHDLATGQKIARFGPHDWPVDRLVFIENGEALVAGQAKGGRDVWDVRKGGRLSRLRDADGTVLSVDISPRGRRVAVLRTDGSVSLRSWDSESLLRGTCAVANRNLTCTEWRQYGGGLPYQPTCKALPVEKCP